MKRAGSSFLTIVMILVLSTTFGYGQEPIKIGMIQPCSGQTATYGLETIELLTQFEKELNDSGGLINGRPVKFIVEDNKGTVEGTVIAVKKLLNYDKVKIILGLSLSNNAMAAKEITKKAGALLLVSGAKHPDVTAKGYKYLFRLNTTQDQDFQGYMEIFRRLKPKRVAILYDSLEYGMYWHKLLRENLPKVGAKIVAEEQVDFTASDFSVLITKFKAAQPDVIAMGITSVSGTIAFAKQMDEMQLKAVKVPMCAGVSPETAAQAGGHLEDAWFIDIYSDSLVNPENDKLIAMVAKGTNGRKRPSKVHILAYDTANVIVNAIRYANSVEPDKVAEALRTHVFPSPRGQKLKFDKQGQVQATYIILTVKNGKVVPRD